MLDITVKIIAAASTLAIGIAAWVIAYRQYKISKARLRFDLYEKRLALYRIISRYTAKVGLGDNRDGFQTLNDTAQFHRETVERYFLFDEDVSSYFEEIIKKSEQLGKAQVKITAGSGDAEQMISECVELKVWFTNQAADAFKVFQKDLAIKSLR